MKRIIVTGGAGFIGSHLCEHLMDLSMEVLCIDNFSDYYAPEMKKRNISSLVNRPGFTLSKANICSLDDLLGTIETSPVDAVIHLAARPGVIPSVKSPALTFESNVIGTQNILEMCRILGIGRVVLASSSSVYGRRNQGPFSESDKTATPESPYGASKIANEVMSYSYAQAYRIKTTCLRFFTVYGPRQRPDMAIHTFVRQVLEHGHLKVYGDPRSSRDYTYVEDIIMGILGTLRNNLDYSIYNLGNSSPVTLGELVETILDATGVEVDVEWLPTRSGDVPLTFADISKARAELGFDPKTSIREGVAKFVEWYKITQRI